MLPFLGGTYPRPLPPVPPPPPQPPMYPYRSYWHDKWHDAYCAALRGGHTGREAMWAANEVYGTQKEAERVRNGWPE